MSYEFAAAAKQWQEEGFAVVEGLIPTDDIDAVAADLERLYSGDTFANYNWSKGFGDGTPEGKQFRSSQFDGMRGFPMHGCPALNDLFFHPRLAEFARHALADNDVRIYQAAVWGKWAGEVNYEQPLHQDGNHSLLPPRMEPGFWHMESFLFLSDVDEDCAPPRLVPKSKSDVAYEDLYEHEVVATGKRGTLMAYRSDVWHRGSDFARPDASRFVAAVAFRPAGADWFGYDPFPRYGNSTIMAKVFAGKTPEDLALFGIPRPGHPFWNEQTVDAMEAKYPGLDVTAWRAALAQTPAPLSERVRRVDERAAATLVADAAVATELEEVAAELRVANDHAGAAQRFLRAAQLTSARNDRARRLQRAGDRFWYLAQFDTAATTTSDAFHLATDPAVRADAAVILGQLTLWESGPDESLDVLLPEAEAIAEADPDRAVALLVHAANTVVASLDTKRALEIGERAVELAQHGSGEIMVAANLARALSLGLAGDAAASEPIMGPIEQIAVMLVDMLDELPEGEHVLNVVGMSHTIREQWDTAEAYLERVVHRARKEGSTATLALAAGNLAEMLFRSGRWREAAALMEDVIAGSQLALQRAWAQAILATHEAHRGVDLAAARQRAEQALTEGDRLGSAMVVMFAAHAVALCAFADGDFANAAGTLDRVAAITAAGGAREPGIAWWQANHVEALWRDGRVTDARNALARFEEDAGRSQRPSAIAGVARCHALMATAAKDMEVAAQRSVDGFGALPAPFEVARTLLVRAERRAAFGQADAAITDAREARVLFASLGASPWIAKAQSFAIDDPFAALTPAERRVVEVIIAGRTNKEAAAELALSVRTIDFHLRAAFRKLEVTNRTELAARALRRD